MEFTAKTVGEAVEKGLAELGISEEEAEITIKEEPTKGLFGRMKGNAVVEITAKEKKESDKSEDIEKPAKKKVKTEDAENAGNIDKAVEFVNKVFDIMDITAKATLAEGEELVINVIAENSADVIGFRGEVLNAIQTLAGSVANIGNSTYKKVVVNCENYRERREETLIALAHRLEEKATEMRREVYLEPMTPFERRIIHTALAESTTVTTKSDGKEPNRFVIIVPNDKDEFSRPYNAGRNGERRNGGRDHGRDGRGRGGKFDRHGSRKSAPRGGSGFLEEKRKTPSGFGTYLGNSLKDKDE